MFKCMFKNLQKCSKMLKNVFLLHYQKKASPSPCGGACSISPATSPQQSRRPSLLHPDHARLHLHHLHHNYHGHGGTRTPPSPDRTSIDEDPPPAPPSPSSSTTSSLRSMPSSTMASLHSSHQDRRRSSRCDFIYNN